MIEIQANFKDVDWKRLKWMFSQGIFSFLGKVRHDVRRLGEGGYKYLKTIIPVSNLPKPHLRDSFKIRTEVIKSGVQLQIYTDVLYSWFLDLGAQIPPRSYPFGGGKYYTAKGRKFMRFRGKDGRIYYRRKVRGGVIKGIHFVDRGESWLAKNVWHYVDPTLGRYL